MSQYGGRVKIRSSSHTQKQAMRRGLRSCSVYRAYNAHWAKKPKKAFAIHLLTLLMTLSPSLCSLSFLTSSPSLSMTLSDHRVLSQPWVPAIYLNKSSLDGSLHTISSNLGVLSYKGPKTLIAHYSKPKQPFQLILALYSPRQKPDRWHWVLTVLRGLNAEITSERFVVFRAILSYGRNLPRKANLKIVSGSR